MLSLIQLIDSSFPTGSFSHSFGLETALQERRVTTSKDLYEWLSSFVRGNLVPMEGMAVYWTYTYIQQKRMDEIKVLDQRVTVSRLARESREGSIKVGKRYLRIILELYPQSNLTTYLQWIQTGECSGNSSIVHGWICAHLDYTVQEAVVSHLYASVNSLVQNALRSMAMGQTEGQKVLASLIPLFEQEAASIVQNPVEPGKMSSYTVMQEISAMRHETLYSRLFMS